MPTAVIRGAVRRARSVRAVMARPPYVPPGHFYSPLTTQRDVQRALSWTDAPGVDLREAGQLALASTLGPLLSERPPGPRYRADNRMYGPGDAAVYRAMLRRLRPSQVIEVGSGYSTALLLDEADADPGLADLELVCIEPFPERLLRLMTAADRRRLNLIRHPVQDVDLSVFQRLGPGDVLFVDSTHVVKAGSDVVWLFLHVLPQLRAGVVVHVHDVFWPFEYPEAWLQQGRDWTENYLVHAFLSGNSDWEVLLFSNWLWRCHPSLIPHQLAQEEPGSLWLRKLR